MVLTISEEEFLQMKRLLRIRIGMRLFASSRALSRVWSSRVIAA
jgi:hypothetical protein